MSGKKGTEKATDRRVERTRGALLGALLELVEEKGYDRTTVQDILDRANVGRSTFYDHFASKEDLLMGRMHLFQVEVEDPGADGALVLPSTTALFAHVGENLALYRSLVKSGTIAMVLRIARQDLETSLQRGFARLEEVGRPLPDTPEFLGRFLAGAFISLMVGWLDAGAPGSPEQMDARFRRLAAAGLGA